MSEVSGKGKGGQRAGAPKKTSGGFWSSLVDTFVGAYSEATAKRAAGARNPTDPEERMEPVRQERQETGRELVFRTTDGAAGQAPIERVNRGRRHIARSVADRSSAGGRATVPGGSGTPLPGAVRKRMEPQLGADLSGVRVHTSGTSAEAATAFGARAFTVGADVHFNAGEFAPGTKEGDKLLAHELTHVVQGQKAGVQRKPADGGHAKHEGGSHEGGAHEGDAHEGGAHEGGAHEGGAHEGGKGVEVSDPNEPAEKEADAVGERVAGDLHGGADKGHAAGADKAPNQAAPAVAAKRIDPISAAPPKLYRADKKKPDLSALNAVRSSVTRTINSDIKALLNNNSIKKALDRDKTIREKRLKEKTELDTELGTLEAEYKKLIETSAPPDDLKSKYDSLKAKATALLDTLKDYTKTAEELVKEADLARKEIAGNHKRAVDTVPDVDKMKVLQLETYKGLKTALKDGFTDVQRRIDEDKTGCKPLPDLRKDKVAADSLRRDAERAAKLTDIDKAIQPFIDKIDDICLNTTKAGRDGASVGDGSTEAAAIEEAKTGKKTQGCWHGPKCRMEAAGLASAIKALREHKTLTTETAIIKRIDDAIQKGETRKSGLDSGASKWDGSKFKPLENK